MHTYLLGTHTLHFSGAGVAAPRGKNRCASERMSRLLWDPTEVLDVSYETGRGVIQRDACSSSGVLHNLSWVCPGQASPPGGPRNSYESYYYYYSDFKNLFITAGLLMISSNVCGTILRLIKIFMKTDLHRDTGT